MAAAPPRNTGATRCCSARRFGVPTAGARTRVGVPGWRRSQHPRSFVAPSRERATTAEQSGAFCATQVIDKAVTTLLRGAVAGRRVTNLLREPRKPAPLLDLGRPPPAAKGEVTTLVSHS